ncbi:uncharacterized protein MKZ38_002627 [Zalerion maritima]|uniref:Proteophosphoglycan 5 n=1 Tax=Zalerion maritima TaxID=339359 RepID=A0AAD5RX53_9PEZI|nr:uncharacterized protein MKZ38_002627 [Zalerion maritima]
MQQNNQQRTKNTPKKGRPRRDSTQSPRNSKPAKNYASENDIPRDSNGVRTPRRETPGAPNHFLGPRGNCAPNSQRNRNKGRPTSIAVAGSPAPPRNDRTSPPLTGGKSAPAAYAGAAFHMSPATSELPIPSFMKAARAGSPNTGGNIPAKPSNLSQVPSPPASDTEAPTPPATRPAQPAELRHDVPVKESPLDIFFRKDREEKERSGRSHSAQGIVAAPSPFSPPEQSPFGTSAANVSRNENQAAGNRASFHRSSTTGISPEELDGTPGRPIGPQFSTPFNDRIRAARGSASSGQATPGSAQRSPGDGATVLKSILNITDQPTIFGSPHGTPSQHTPPFAGSPNRFVPGHHMSRSTGTNAPMQGLATGVQIGQAPDPIAMTNSLKNLLKIQ